MTVYSSDWPIIFLVKGWGLSSLEYFHFPAEHGEEVSRLLPLHDPDLDRLAAQPLVQLHRPQGGCSGLVLAAVPPQPVVDDVPVSSPVIVGVEDHIAVSRVQDTVGLLWYGHQVEHLHSEDLLHTGPVVHHPGVGRHRLVGVKSLSVKLGLDSLCHSFVDPVGGGFPKTFLVISSNNDEEESSTIFLVTIF